MAQHGIHSTLDSLKTKKRHVEDWLPLLVGSDAILAA
jgi:hypothetical protein